MSNFTKGSKDKLLIKETKESKSKMYFATNEKKLNLQAKHNYHTQGLQQSKIGFWLSIVGATMGIIIIAFSFFIPKYQSQLGMIIGILIEVMSTVILVISNNANKRMVEFFDKLRLDSNTVNSIELMKTIKNEDIRDELAVKLSLHLIGINEENICKHSRSVCLKSEEVKSSSTC